MQKKILLSLPIAPLKTNLSLQDEVKKTSPGWGQSVKNYIYVAKIDKTTSESVLIVDFYKPSGEHQWSYFLNKKGEYFSFTKDKKISTAGMDYILEYLSWCKKYFCDKKTSNIIHKFLKIKENEVSAIEAIAEVNSKAKHQKHEKLVDKQIKKFDIDMQKIKPMPKRVEKWIDNDLLKANRYIIYKYAPTKKVDGFCTHCQTEVNIERPHNHSTGICPSCKSAVTFLAKLKVSKYGFTDKKDFCYIQPTKTNEIILREFVVKRFFDCNGTVSQTFDEFYRTFYTIGGKYLHSQSQYMFGFYQKNREEMFYRVKNACSFVETANFYPYNINRIFKKHNQELLNIDCDEIMKNLKSINLSRFLSALCSYECIENLAKSGFYQIIRDIINGHVYEFNLHQKSVRKFLEISKKDIALIQSRNPTLQYMRFFNNVRKVEPTSQISEIDSIYKLELDRLGENLVLDLLKITTLHQFAKYALSQNFLIERRKKQYWLDYFSMAQTLKYDLKNPHTLFPKDVLKAHDRAKVENNDRAYALKLKKLSAIKTQKPIYDNLYSYKTKDFLITAPADYEDIRNEGIALDHCVETYAERVARGETIILFIRKIAEPQKPYFTLNIDPKTHQVLQNLGLHDCQPPTKVINFVKSYEKRVLAKIKSNEKKAG